MYLFGVTLEAPSQATGSEKKHPKIVPTQAIIKVSIAGNNNSGSSLISKLMYRPIEAKTPLRPPIRDQSVS